jgi:ABC-type multidrug transport system ATPase subunit
MYSHFTSRENLSFALSLRGLKIAQKKIDTSLDSFDLLASANKPISIFSKGMLQRLKLVFADLAPWDLLLFDEPFSGLDSNGIEIIERQLNNWKKIINQ